MKHIKAVALFAGGLVFLPSLVTSYIVFAYLTEYGTGKNIVSLSILLFGVCVSGIIYLTISQKCKGLGTASIIPTVLLMLIAVALISMYYPARITYSRFGLTVYGVIPVPILDVAIGPKGRLWFRDKSHFVSVDEVNRILSPDTEVLIIGTGWRNQTKVDEAVGQVKNCEIHILPTRQAFDLFNRYKREGKKVALLAHSTC